MQHHEIICLLIVIHDNVLPFHKQINMGALRTFDLALK
jgi:hypothetical protein